MGGPLMLVAAGAALASPIGGLVAVLINPTTLLLSVFVGYAGGVLMGTFAFEMMPKALEQSSLLSVVAGFALALTLVTLGGVLINLALRASYLGPAKSATAAFVAFTVFYVVAAVVTRVRYRP